MEQGMKQSMAITAAMQMFMRILQSTNMELSQIASQAMASNPALEEISPSLPQEVASDENLPHNALDYNAAERHDFLLNSLSREETLSEALSSQVRQNGYPPDLCAAALALIGNMDNRGYFDAPPEEIARREGISPELLAQALQIVRNLEPSGVGAIDLRESLLLQLQRLNEGSGLPAQLIKEHWDHLVRHRYAEAAKSIGVSEEDVIQAARRIARLNPDPGSAYAQTERNVIIPDIIVDIQNGVPVARLTGEGVPQLSISPDYREMMTERAHDVKLRQYLSRCFREGRDLIKAINDRQQTILEIARAIITRQKDFFLKGPRALLPLKMEDIAEDCGVHLSTISRAVNGKYLRCHFGVFELRSFFGTGLPRLNRSEAVSSGSVQARIRALIEEENPKKPLSDAKIETLLAQEGIIIARRTVAKYRDILKILPANLRKQK